MQKIRKETTISQTDIRLLGKGGCEAISQDHLQDDPQRRKWYACRKLPTQDEQPPAQAWVPGPRYQEQHTRTPSKRLTAGGSGIERDFDSPIGR